MLEIRNLTKTFGSESVLKTINLSLAPDQTHVLLGSSGSGKSTLLRAILGLVDVDSGTVVFRGEALDRLSSARRAECIGYVPQGGGLFPHLTVAGNATLVAKAQGWDNQRIRDRLEDMIGTFALDPALLNRYPKEISGGQRQRAAALRAAFMNPPVLLLDEPLGALDPMVRATLQTELKALFKRLKKTVIFVTHDIGEAAYLGDQIILLHEGRVVQTGSFADLQDRPAEEFVTRFINAQRVFETERRS